MSSDIVVIGSINMDMVVAIDHRPVKGETVLGSGFFMSPGGKGANQAYAASRLGASTLMLGKVGQDAFGEQLLENLQQVGIDTSCIDRVDNISSGIALISIDAEGDNSIIVAPGANMALKIADIDRWEDRIKQAKMVLLQLEIPLESVMHATEIARKHGIPVLIDPAPAQPLPDRLLQIADYISPNETELSALTGIQVHDAESAMQAASILLSKGVGTVLAKLGSQGVAVVRRDQTVVIDSYKVDAVDTTAAGDAFAGAFATAIVSGEDLLSAVRFANAVGAITVTRKGAQASMPDMQQVERFMNENK
jgi:ribokinase